MKSSLTTRIIGGQVAPSPIPWQAGLLVDNSLVCGATIIDEVWQYGLWSFQTGYTKLERFLQKNQHTQRKLLNFENWTNGEPQ